MSFQPGATAGVAGIAIGTIMAYTEFNTDITVNTTTEGTANTIVTAAAFVPNGTDQFWIEFFAPSVLPAAVGTAQILVVIYDNGSALAAGTSAIAQILTPAGANMTTSVLAKRKVTPTAVSHAYSIRAYEAGGAGSVRGSCSGVSQPGYVAIMKAA